MSGIQYGVDIHPQFQDRISPEQIAKEDFKYLVAKASQGTWQQLDGSRDYVNRAQATRMLAGYYHFLDSDNVWAQLEAFLEVVGAPDGKIICVDFEDPKDYGIPMRGAPSITDLYNFVYALRDELEEDHPIWIYSAGWYFDLIGNPDITALMKDKNCIPWASRYVNGTGYASEIYQSVPARWWNGEDNGGFGGQKPKVLQFTDRASVAGYQVDANAFRGTEAELKALSTSHKPVKPPEKPGNDKAYVRIGPVRTKVAARIAKNHKKLGREAVVETEAGGGPGKDPLRHKYVKDQNTGQTYEMSDHLARFIGRLQDKFRFPDDVLHTYANSSGRHGTRGPGNAVDIRIGKWGEYAAGKDLDLGWEMFGWTLDEAQGGRFNLDYAIFAGLVNWFNGQGTLPYDPSIYGSSGNWVTDIHGDHFHISERL